MGESQILVRHACITRGKVVLAEYSDGSLETSRMAAKCMGGIPPHHKRYNHTSMHATFACIIMHPYVYSAIADEALTKPHLFSFLQQLMEEFTRWQISKIKPTTYNGEQYCCMEELYGHSLEDAFAPIIASLVNPLVGIPKHINPILKEPHHPLHSPLFSPFLLLHACKQVVNANNVELASSPSFHNASSHTEEHATSLEEMSELEEANFMIPLDLLRGEEMKKTEKAKKTKKNKKRMGMAMVKEKEDVIREEVKIIIEKKEEEPIREIKEIFMVEGSPPLEGGKALPMRTKGQRMWWQNVRLILFLDFIACLILFSIWMGICQGLSCLKSP